MVDQEWQDRFNAKWAAEEDGCWVWFGASLGENRYGIIKVPGTRRQEYAHRLSWLIHRGKIPKGKYVLHRCDNPRCVNPAHLFLGSAKVNALDMKGKARHLYGERNGNSQLIGPDVVKIKELLATGKYPQHRIAAMFGVSQITISRIKRGVRWSHLK